MTIEQAIKRAKDAGYDVRTIILDLDPSIRDFRYDTNRILLDPAFWESLGKAMEWGIEPSGSIWQGQPKWRIRWHRFIDHLAEGGTPETFFKDLDA